MPVLPDLPRFDAPELLDLNVGSLDEAAVSLTDLRRLNVAITRPRKHLFVVGDSATLSGHPHYAKWIEFVQSTGGYRSAWEWPGA